MLDELFLRKKPDIEKCMAFGFQKRGENYLYSASILGGSFLLHVTLSPESGIKTNLIERETGEEYVLYKTNSAGPFVGQVRNAVFQVLSEIEARCYESGVFVFPQSAEIIRFVCETYGNELQFPFKNLPDCAVWRREDTQKWYGTLARLSGRKLGLPFDEITEILNLHARPENISALLQRKGFYPGWHMNKKHWFTIVLDGTVKNGEILSLIDESRRLAK